MKKIKLNLSAGTSDVLSPEELKNIVLASKGEGSYSSGSEPEEGYILGQGEYIYGCSFAYDPDGKKGLGYEEFFIHYEPGIPDFKSLCKQMCSDKVEFFDEACTDADGWKVYGPGDKVEK